MTGTLVLFPLKQQTVSHTMMRRKITTENSSQPLPPSFTLDDCDSILFDRGQNSLLVLVNWKFDLLWLGISLLRDGAALLCDAIRGFRHFDGASSLQVEECMKLVLIKDCERRQ